MDNYFGNLLKKSRLDNGLTQNDIANALLLSKSTVCNWEKGNREPSIEDIRKLAVILDVSCDYLLGLENEAGGKTDAAEKYALQFCKDKVKEKEKVLTTV